MYFESLSAALQMGGHGVFVWPIYAAAAVVIAGLVVLPRRRQKHLIREIRGAWRREGRQEKS